MPQNKRPSKEAKVIKKSSEKTIKVAVESRIPHKLYKKIQRVTKTYLVHDENQVANKDTSERDGQFSDKHKSTTETRYN